MPTFIYISGAFLIAICLGIISVYIDRRGSKWVSIPFKTLSTIIAIIISSISLLYGAIFLTFSNSRDWSDLDSIAIVADYFIKTPSIAQRSNYFRYVSSRSAYRNFVEISPDIIVQLFYPKNVRVGDDVTLALRVTSPRMEKLGSAVRSASLRFNGSGNVWTSQSCDGSSNDRTQVFACSAAQREMNFVWTASFSASGTRQLSVIYGRDLIAVGNWSAFISTNGMVIGDKSENTNFQAEEFNSQRTFYTSKDGGILVSLATGEIRFALDVVTTIGISSQIYAILAAIGVFLSGALGSGWLFKLIESFKAPPRAPHTPFEPARRKSRDRD